MVPYSFRCAFVLSYNFQNLSLKEAMGKFKEKKEQNRRKREREQGNYVEKAGARECVTGGITSKEAK